MSLRTLKKVSVVALLSLTTIGIVTCSSDRGGPGGGAIRHVVLISIDTCRADRLSCYGHTRKTTPNIDAVAARGTVFDNVLAQVPLTLPSHCSMLTGTIPPYHGVRDNLTYRLAPSNVTLATWLKQRNYATAAVIGAYVLKDRFGLNQGFDSYDDEMDDSSSAAGEAERRGSTVSRLAIEWLEQHHETSFFLFLHYFDPHGKYTPPEPFASKFADDLYDGEIAYADHCIGQVIDKLKELGIDDQTLLIITADHAEMLHEHGEPMHGYFIYQGAMRVPLIIRLPQGAEGRRIEQPVSLIDLVPTICGLLGIDAPPAVQGSDLSGLLTGPPSQAPDRHLYCESLTPTKYGANALIGVRHGRWKYIQTTRPELYDLDSDPGELKNLADQDPDRARELHEALRQLLAAHGRDDTDSRAVVDTTAQRHIEGLGYAAGGVDDDSPFDQSKEDPKDLIAFHVANQRVLYLIGDKKIAEAEQVCREQLAQRPDFVVGHMQLARIAQERENWGAAVRHLREALRLDPDDAENHYNLAQALSQQKNWDETILHYRRAVEIDPLHLEAHNKLGLALVEQNEIDEAATHFKRALSINADFTAARTNLAKALAEQGKPEDAIKHHRQILQTDPNDAQTHFDLGAALAASGQMGEAMEHYRHALRIDPYHADAHNGLGVGLAKQGKFGEAIAAYRNAIRIKPDLAQALNNLAYALLRQGQTAEAAPYYERAIAANPDYALAHSGLAAVLAAQKKFNGALKHFRSAHRVQPDQPMTMAGMAWILATHPDDAVRNPTEAIALAQRAAELTDRRQPRILDALAAAQAAAGQFDEATNTAQAALEQAANAPALAQLIRKRLARYREGQSFVERIQD